MPGTADASILGVVEDRWWPGVALLAAWGCVPPDAASKPAAASASTDVPGAGSSRSGLVAASPLARETGTQKTSAAAHTRRSPRASAAARDGDNPHSGWHARSSSLSGSPISGVFRDFFERPTLGPDYNATSTAWRMQRGRLCAARARNHPVWLRRRLPPQARIEFDAMSSSADGDIKVEAWGDGTSAASGLSYGDATSYLFIYGGWKNRLHVLARLNEHGDDRKALDIAPSGQKLNARPVRPHRIYHFKIERSDSKTVRWLVDDIEILDFTDPSPLVGEGHDHFAFNDWETPICFDNLTITPL